MSETKTVIVRPGIVEYMDLCEHVGMSREDFFTESEPKIMRKYGLIMKCEKYVRVMDEDDTSHNDECEGLVIPRGCVLSISYFDITEESLIDDEFRTLSNDENIN